VSDAVIGMQRQALLPGSIAAPKEANLYNGRPRLVKGKVSAGAYTRPHFRST